MCIICECEEKKDYTHLINLEELYCAFCPNLKEIPATLVNLKELDCSWCQNLNEIPAFLVNLEELYCRGCPNLKEIPASLVNLERLDCYNCTFLWKENPTYIQNYQKMLKLQWFIRVYLRLVRVCEFMNSREGREWYYHPENFGGYKYKLRSLGQVEEY